MMLDYQSPVLDAWHAYHDRAYGKNSFRMDRDRPPIWIRVFIGDDPWAPGERGRPLDRKGALFSMYYFSPRSAMEDYQGHLMANEVIEINEAQARNFRRGDAVTFTARVRECVLRNENIILWLVDAKLVE
jgi:hypothetical protein